MAKYLFLSLALGAAALTTYLYFHLGVSQPVIIQLEDKPEMHLLYVTHIGAYHEIGPDLQKVEAWAKNNGVSCRRTFGEFLDDPEAMDQDRLRSHIGCVTDALVPNDKPPLPEGFISETRPARRYAVGLYKGSPAISPFTVYPKMKTFLDEQRLSSKDPVLEIYQINGEAVETQYLFPL